MFDDVLDCPAIVEVLVVTIFPSSCHITLRLAPWSLAPCVHVAGPVVPLLIQPYVVSRSDPPGTAAAVFATAAALSSAAVLAAAVATAVTVLAGVFLSITAPSAAFFLPPVLVLRILSLSIRSHPTAYRPGSRNESHWTRRWESSSSNDRE